MHETLRNRWSRLTLALCLPWLLAATAVAQQAQPKPAVEGLSLEELQQRSATIDHGMLGTILRISENELDVRELTEGSGGRKVVRLGGGPDVAVTGEKQSWQALAQGDLIAVSYRGDPARAQGIRVLPPTAHPAAKVVIQQDLYDKPDVREFVGWIKYIDAKTVVLRTPDGPPGTKRKGGVKTFARQQGTVVELLRDSWDALKKGDRVAITFRKGEPRPAERVKVVLRGGEKPLPRGLATRLFDPTYDQSVKDVDGIGEWPIGKPWPPTEAAQSGAAPKPAPAPAP
jgi:hypothetical protein